MQSGSKSSIHLYNSQSKNKLKQKRKIPDPYLNLFHKNKEYERIQNSIKIYQNKKNLLKRKFQIKKLKVSHINQSSQNKQNYQKESSHIFYRQEQKYSNRTKNQTLHSVQRKNNPNSQIRYKSIIDDSRLSLNGSSISQKQKFSNYICKMVQQRKTSRQQNQNIMKQNSLVLLHQKKFKIQNTLKFQQNLQKKRDDLVKSYIDKVHKNQQSILRQLKPLQLLRQKQILRMRKTKQKITEDIVFLKKKNKSLNRQFAKISNLKSDAMVEHVMRSSIISMR